MTRTKDVPTIFGHPAGLFTLFFAEMWERFSYYGMRALLLYYMIKGFLGLNDTQAYGVYGAYTALVYMTPYFGGILADKLLGRRRAVVLGGLLMAAGHLLMTIEQPLIFYTALAFLIVGNGFFKPNISTIVGELYPKVSEKKDTGFTIFYMGINLGAAMSPILCGYVGETYGWHYGFGLATAGMLIGVAVFVMPTRVTQLLIGGGALGTSVLMCGWLWDSTMQLIVRLLMGIMLTVAGVTAVRALEVGALPDWAGAPPDPKALKKKVGGVLRADFTVYIGSIVAVAIFTFIVQRGQVAAIVLNGVGLVAFGYLLFEAIFRCGKVERQRLFVVVILAVFHTAFWAFFEQAGTSLSNWTDRNIDRVDETAQVQEKDVGTTIEMRVDLKTDDAELSKLPVLTQEQLGHHNGDPAMADLVAKAIKRVEAKRNEKRDDEGKITDEQIDELVAELAEQKHDFADKGGELQVFSMTSLTYLREAARPSDKDDAAEVEAAKEFSTVGWKVVPSNVGMGLGEAELPASEFQAANPVYILLFGLVFSGLWTFLVTQEDAIPRRR